MIRPKQHHIQLSLQYNFGWRFNLSDGYGQQIPKSLYHFNSPCIIYMRLLLKDGCWLSEVQFPEVLSHFGSKAPLPKSNKEICFPIQNCSSFWEILELFVIKPSVWKLSSTGKQTQQVPTIYTYRLPVTQCGSRTEQFLPLATIIFFPLLLYSFLCKKSDICCHSLSLTMQVKNMSCLHYMITGRLSTLIVYELKSRNVRQLLQNSFPGK